MIELTHKHIVKLIELCDDEIARINGVMSKQITPDEEGKFSAIQAYREGKTVMNGLEASVERSRAEKEKELLEETKQRFVSELEKISFTLERKEQLNSPPEAYTATPPWIVTNTTQGGTGGTASTDRSIHR